MKTSEYHITTEYIELNQLLKLCGWAASGGAGAALVSEGNVTVDGKPEVRKRCKIRPGQVVQLGEAQVTVSTADAEAMAASHEAQSAKARLKAEKLQNRKNAKKAAAWAAKLKAKDGVKIPVKGGAAPGPKARSKENALAAAKARGVTTLEAPWKTSANKESKHAAKVSNQPATRVPKIAASTKATPVPVAPAATIPHAVVRPAKPRPNVFAEKAEAYHRRKR